MPVAQALGLCAGGLAMPILFGGAVVDSGALGRGTRKLERELLGDAAIDERIDLAIAAICAPPKPVRARTRREPK
jgi:hypothetical protein